MLAPILETSSATNLRPIEGATRTLLRYVNRSALDDLTAAFTRAMGYSAAVLSSGGELVAGELARCPACPPRTLALKVVNQVPAEPSRPGWVRCDHGWSSLTMPIHARTGEQLATLVVGPMVLSEPDWHALRRAVDDHHGDAHQVQAFFTRTAHGTTDRVEAAAHLLAQTLDTVVREAMVASEHADLVATQRQANHELTVLYSVLRALSSGIDLKTILQQLADVISEQLHSDVTLVGLIEDDELVTVASCGFLTFEARNGRLRVGEGLAGRVAATGQPLTCRDMQDDPRQYLTAINSREHLHAFAGVPLRQHGEIIGVLAVYRREPHATPDNELQLLVHIADQAVIAMERARLYEQKRLTADELRTLQGQVTSQHQALERVMTVHDRLTQMVLHDVGLEAIVDSLARLLELPVAVEDQFHHALTHGPRDPKTQAKQGTVEPPWTPPASLQRPEIQRFFKIVRETRRPVAFPALPDLGMPHSRLVTPVVVGDDMLGFLSVSERERPLEETDRLALGHAATVIALEMMKQRTRAEVQRRLRGELLEEMVANEVHDTEEVQRRAAHLGYNLAIPHALFLIVPADSGDVVTPAPPRGIRASLADVVKDLVAEHGSGSMIMSRVDGILVALPVADGAATEARAIAESLQRGAARRGVAGVGIGLGRICHSADDFSISCKEARWAIDLARSLGSSNRVVSFEDLGVYRLLVDLPRPTDAVRFAEQLLAPLDAYDIHHGGSLMATLEAYLAANGILQRAATSMAVHVNTLTYRLQRISELTNLDLDDSNARLEAHLALKIREVLRLSLG